jgi:hypothetical protein
LTLQGSIHPTSATRTSLIFISLGPFGFPLSSDSNSNTRSGEPPVETLNPFHLIQYRAQDWALFSAAAAPDMATRNLLIAGVHKRASSNTTAGAFSPLYNVETGLGVAAGTYPNGFARRVVSRSLIEYSLMVGLSSPAQGAMFSVLALKYVLITLSTHPNPYLKSQRPEQNCHCSSWSNNGLRLQFKY